MPTDGRHGAFERHLREAIALNRERAPLYAAASGGASRRVSTTLIRLELVLLPLARWFDRQDAPYAHAGVPLLGHLFEPMPAGAPAPLAGGRPASAIRPADRGAPAALRIWRRVRRAERCGGFPAAAATLSRELEALEPYPASDCMLRHMLESARRIATMAPLLADRAIASGQPDPARLLRRLFALHLWGLAAATRLDRAALPVQRQGVPILEQDLPHIPAVPLALPPR